MTKTRSQQQVMGPASPVIREAAIDELVRLPQLDPSSFRTWRSKVEKILQCSSRPEEVKVISLQVGLPPEAYHRVEDLKSVEELMEVLEQLYQPCSTANAQLLLQKWSELKLREPVSLASIEQHIIDYSSLESQVIQQKLFSYDMLPLHFMQTLPSCLSQFKSEISVLRDLGGITSTNQIIGRLRVWAGTNLNQSENGKINPTTSNVFTCYDCKKSTKCFSHANKSPSAYLCSAHWILDSGASNHICNDEDLFQHLDNAVEATVQVGDGRKMAVKGRGAVNISDNLRLTNVIYCPTLAVNLISVSCLVAKGCEVNFRGDSFRVAHNGQEILSGSRSNGLFVVANEQEEKKDAKGLAVITRSHISPMTWHKRFSHACKETLEKAASGHVFHGPLSFDGKLECETCKLCKNRAVPHKSVVRNTELLELIHSDVCGPLPPSRTGSIYFVTFTDDHSKRSFVYPMKSRTEVIGKFRIFKSFVENQTNHRIKRFRSDRAREYEFGAMKEFLETSGIEQELTAPYSPEQNGVSERLNQTLEANVRAILLDAKLPQEYWEDALMFVTYVKNRTPSRTLEWKTPHEKYFGNVPVVKHLRVFGCKVFVRRPMPLRNSKFAPTAEEGILIGYLSSGYRILTRSGKEVFSMDVEFDETSFPGVSSQSPDVSILLTRVIPNTIEEAQDSEDSEKWKSAMDEEMSSLQENQTWTLVQLPQGRKALDNRWVYAIKRTDNGDIERYKARLVVKGFQQQYGLDFDETYASVTSLRALRTVLNYAATNDLIIEQLDIKTAFLNGFLEEEVYMKQPKGYVVDTKKDYVCKLEKSLYGLKQAPYVWYQTLCECLREIGFTPTISEESIYIKKNGPILLGIIVTFVDDLLVIAKSQDVIDFIKAHLKQHFEIYEKGPLKYFLGLSVERNLMKKEIYLNQKLFIIDVLERFKMTECKPVSSPMEVGLQLEKATLPSDRTPYRELLGCLMYIMIATRPDIAFVVSYLARFAHAHDDTHWEAAKRVLRYLKSTMDYKLRLGGAKQVDEILCYTDADWAGDIETRRSTAGALNVINSGCLTWKSKLQSRVTKSSTEAEYIATNQGVTDAIYIKNLMQELTVDLRIILLCDNQGAIHWTTDRRDSTKAKHVAIKYHFIRELVREKEVEVRYVPTEAQKADVLTKILPRVKLEDICKYLFTHGKEGC